MKRETMGIVIQARMGSERLPGKTLLPILEKPVLQHMIERVCRVRGVKVVVATSRLETDDKIADLCEMTGILCVRGDERDVIGRFVMAAQEFRLEAVVRLTGDCPLVDPETVSAMIDEFLSSDFDYYSNVRQRTFPRGLDCEIFKTGLLMRAYEEKIPEDIPEYVVIPFVNRVEKELEIGHYLDSTNHSDLRWTLDQKEDYELIQKIYAKLYPKKKDFGYRDILGLYEMQPELRKINAKVPQKSI